MSLNSAGWTRAIATVLLNARFSTEPCLLPWVADGPEELWMNVGTTKQRSRPPLLPTLTWSTFLAGLITLTLCTKRQRLIQLFCTQVTVLQTGSVKKKITTSKKRCLAEITIGQTELK